MYDTSLAVYREYIQNSCDAIRQSRSKSKGTILIDINPSRRSVKLRDNGPGLRRDDIESSLVSVSQSNKLRGRDIGFRGIGRLAGLAFADSVIFRTRSTPEQRIIELVWDGTSLRRLAIENRLTPSEIIKRCVNLVELDGHGWPDHFFEVEIRDVARFAAGEILNEDAVRSYIAETCPVPLRADFPFSLFIDQMFDDAGVPLATVDIRLCGSEESIKRPFGPILMDLGRSVLPFVGFEWFSIPAPDSTRVAALVWLAHTDYKGALPRNLLVRGLRAREGNLQIGSDKVFDHLFPESRFNRWCVGEVHVLDPRIVPNGRRDYFEPGPHTRNLENHLESIARRVGDRCRIASTGRIRIRKLVAELDQTEIVYELAKSGYLNASDARMLAVNAVKRLEEVCKQAKSLDGWTTTDQNRLNSLEAKLRTFRPKRGRPAFGRVHKSEIRTYQKIFCALAETSPTPEIAMKTIEGILALA